MGNFAFGQIWDGSTSNSWGEPTNWDNNSVPGISDDVIIGDPDLYDLEIVGIEQCNNITFIDDGIIFFTTAGTFGSNGIEVHGDLINNSNNANIVGNNNGHITMAGSSTPAVIGGTQAIELFHLGIGKDNSSDIVDVNVDLSIWLSIKLTKGELNSNSNLRLRADLTNATTASNTPFSADSRINGRVIVEQRVPYSGLYNHYLSSPVGDETQNGYYTLDAQMADNASSANVYNWTNNYINSSFPDWFVYDETECAGETPAQVITYYQTTLSVTLTTAEAEWVLTTFGWESNGNLLTDQLLAGTGVLSRVEFDTPGNLVDWRGQLNDGQIRVDLNKTTCDFGDGLNLVGNPYPSPIDWDLLYDINDTEVEPFAYVWTPDAGATTAFGAGPGDGYFTVMDASNSTAIITSPNWSDESGAVKDSIAIGQGFFVRALADNSRLDFENTCRNLFNPVSHILRETKPKEALQLVLQSPSGKDYTNIYLDNLASDDYNNKEDALKMPNPHVNLTSMCDDKKLMVNRLSRQKNEIEVPIIISQKAGETSSLSIGNAAFESNEYIALFIDKKLNKQTIITNNFKYNYTSQTGEESDRFLIKFVKGSASFTNTDHSLGSLYEANSQLNIFGDAMDMATIIISDASGRIVQQENVIFTNNKAQLNLNELSNGIYIVNVNSNNNSFNQKVFINK